MRTIPFFSLTDHHRQISSELFSAFEQCLQDSQFILGSRLKEFEESYARFQGSSYCIGVGNGLDALKIALQAIGIEPGDEVLVPSHTFVATALAVANAGAIPIFIEPDMETHNLDPELIERSISKRSRAIIPVHMYGSPCDMNRIAEIARHFSLHIVEDNAQAHGAVYDGKKTGSLGDIAATSFYPTKNLGALGDGGAITTNDSELAKKCQLLRNYGSNKKYLHEILGVNSRLDELQAAFLSEKLKWIDQVSEERRTLAKSYSELLRDVPQIQVPKILPHAQSVFHLYPIRAERRDELQAYLERHGVMTMIHYPIPVPLQSCFSYLRKDSNLFAASSALAQSVLSLPIYPGLSVDVPASIVSLIREFYA